MVLRSAGSHSPVDLLAGKDGNRLIVQVKSGGGRITDEELKELIRWAKTSNCDAEVWRFSGRGSPDRQTVYRPEHAQVPSSVKRVDRRSSRRGKSTGQVRSTRAFPTSPTYIYSRKSRKTPF